MDRENKNQYLPDYVSPPGETIQEVLDALGMTQAGLAERTGRSQKTINEIIKGKAPITPETAIQFERVVGIPAHFWNNREKNYREFLAMEQERKALESEIDWLKKFPLKPMITFDWVKKYDDQVLQLREMLQFFGVTSPKQWELLWLEGHRASYRQSKVFEANPYAVSAWLRRGQLFAQKIATEPYNRDTFISMLDQIRKLTRKDPDDFQPELVRVCAKSGVAVVFVRELPKIRTYGATLWLTPNKALIQLCLRNKTNDYLWFTFFHEASHILYHGKRDIFIEEDEEKNEKEMEADNYAADLLIPTSEWERFICHFRASKEDILRFAAEMDIAPGIIVGRLQHEQKVLFSQFNTLKVPLTWAASN